MYIIICHSQYVPGLDLNPVPPPHPDVLAGGAARPTLLHLIRPHLLYASLIVSRVITNLSYCL